MSAILGIDIGKSEFSCELADGDKHAHRKFSNTVAGFGQLSAWLRNRKAHKVRACMEATGGWSEEVAVYLQEHGHIVSIVNPLQIRAFGQSELSRTKTDKADAALIARYCAAMDPPPWSPPTAQERRLRQLVRRRRVLVKMHTQEHNRLDSPGTESVEDSIRASVAFFESEIATLEKQIIETIDGDDDLRSKRDLIETIPGVGPGTSAPFFAKYPTSMTSRTPDPSRHSRGFAPKNVTQEPRFLVRGKLGSAIATYRRRCIWQRYRRASGTPQSSPSRSDFKIVESGRCRS